MQSASFVFWVPGCTFTPDLGFTRFCTSRLPALYISVQNRQFKQFSVVLVLKSEFRVYLEHFVNGVSRQNAGFFKKRDFASAEKHFVFGCKISLSFLTHSTMVPNLHCLDHHATPCKGARLRLGSLPLIALAFLEQVGRRAIDGTDLYDMGQSTSCAS